MPRFGGVPIEEERKPRFRGIPVELVASQRPKAMPLGAELMSLASQANPLLGLMAPPAQGSTAQFQQGLTMGWGDELNAVKAGWGAMLPGGQSPGEAYDAAMAQQQGEREIYDKSNPGMAFTAELAGGVMGAGKIGSGIKAGKTAAQMLPRMVATGGAAGALAGAGSANPDERGAGAITGGLIGAAAGPLLQGGVRVGKDAWKLISNAASPSVGAADEAVVGAMSRDGQSLDQLRKALLEAPAGVPVSVADNASPGVQSLLSGAAVTPGKAQQVVRDTFDARLGEQGDRVRDAVAKSAGPREYAVTLAEEIKAIRWEKAKPLYEEAFASGPVNNSRVLEILKDPDVSRAFGTAQKIAAREGIELAPMYRMGKDKLTVDRVPDVRTLDYVKRALDGEIDSGFRSGNTANAASLKKLRNEMVDLIDKASPAYKTARSVYSSASEVMEAIEQGQRALNMGDGQLAAALKSFKSAAEQEAFRKAALDTLSDKLNTSEGAKTINDLIGSEKARRNLRLIVGEDAYPALQKRLLAEQQIRKTGARVNPSVGPQTAMRQGDAGALPETMSLWQNLANKNFFAAAAQGVNALKQRGQGLTDEARGKMAGDLLTDDKAAQAAYLDRLAAAQKRMDAARRKKGFLGASAAGGTLAGLLSD